MMYQDIRNGICQNTKKMKTYYPLCQSAAQLLFKSRSPKGGPTCRRQAVNPRHQTPQGQSVAKPETPLQNIQSWLAGCDIKGSDDTILNPVFWKTIQGQRHLGRWEILECQIPIIKMLFKTNTECHKHSSIHSSTTKNIVIFKCLTFLKRFLEMAAVLTNTKFWISMLANRP